MIRGGIHIFLSMRHTYQLCKLRITLKIFNVKQNRNMKCKTYVYPQNIALVVEGVDNFVGKSLDYLFKTEEEEVR